MINLKKKLFHTIKINKSKIDNTICKSTNSEHRRAEE